MGMNYAGAESHWDAIIVTVRNWISNLKRAGLKEACIHQCYDHVLRSILRELGP